MKVESQVSKKEMQRFLSYYCFRKGFTGNRIGYILLLSLWFGYSVGNGEASRPFRWLWFFESLIVTAMILYLIIFVIPYVIGRVKLSKSWATEQGETQTFTTSDLGITIRQNDQERFLNWESIRIADVGNGYIYLILFSKKFYLIPRTAFQTEDEVENFLGIIGNGILKVRGKEKPKDPKRLYRWGLLGFIPNVGLIAGIILIARGIFQYKDKWMVLIGLGGILFTLGFWSVVFNSSSMVELNVESSKTLLNNLAKNIEFYKLQNGSYPDSLKQMVEKDSLTVIFIYDPLGRGSLRNEDKFNYQKKGSRYTVFSSGKDRIPNTSDDIYPDRMYFDTTKFGLIK